jgi:hypothetical protein
VLLLLAGRLSHQDSSALLRRFRLFCLNSFRLSLLQILPSLHQNLPLTDSLIVLLRTLDNLHLPLSKLGLINLDCIIAE